jgi:hypothetical protein
LIGVSSSFDMLFCVGCNKLLTNVAKLMVFCPLIIVGLLVLDNKRRLTVIVCCGSDLIVG